MGRQGNIKGANQKEDGKRQKACKDLFPLFFPPLTYNLFPFLCLKSLFWFLSECVPFDGLFL